MKAKEALRALAALSQANRLRIFRLLVVAGQDGARPGTIASKLKVSPATLSFHLKELANAGLVSQERSGRSLIYRADYRTMNGLLEYLTDNCCQGAACEASTEPTFKR